LETVVGKGTMIGQQALLFRIELQNILPSIWREVLVPSGYSFWDLHVAIQNSMGWLDCHLHAFHVQDLHSAALTDIGIPDEEIVPDVDPVLAGWEVPLRSYLNEAGQAVVYEYDFGDSWEHRILLKEITPQEQDAKYPICVGGKRACPPEDCGGIWGYQTLLEAINDPFHEEHENLLKWLGTEFDPEHLDLAKVRFDDPKQRWKQAFEHLG
jgi:Plasmid pRiA4b ORF-3-like protein